MLREKKNKNTMVINILGLDPSLNNWGIALAKYDTSTQELSILQGNVLQTKPDKANKQNIQDLYSAEFLYTNLKPSFEFVDIISAELPYGSQTSRAMVSYALCIGVLGSLKHTNPNVVPVTPQQVKNVVGSSTASKKEVINWVKNNHQEVLSWLPKAVSKSEHICDAIVSIHVMLNTKQFKDYIHEINN